MLEHEYVVGVAVTVTVEGADEAAAMEAITTLFASDFGEPV
jgi:phosphotransferase system HPr-like phosphotransfer protein